MEEAGFCGRGMIDMVAGLGRGGGGGGGGGGWYHEGWSTETKKGHVTNQIRKNKTAGQYRSVVSQVLSQKHLLSLAT